MHIPIQASIFGRGFRRIAGMAVLSLCLMSAPRTAQAALVDFVCYLNGPESATTSTAVGTGRFTLDTVANTLNYEIRFGGLSTPETVAHIHGPAGIGVNASPVHTLPPGRVKTGVWNLSDSEEAMVLSGLTYVNVHSTTYPGGEIRGQIVNFVSPMDGVQAGTGASGAGRGWYLINTADNVVTYTITYSGLSGAESASHIHGFGGFGTNQGIVFPLSGGTTKTGVWNYSEADEAEILAGLTYVNIHTALHTGGEIRGQIVRIVTTLDGDQEGVTTNAVGTGLYSLDTANTQLGYYITYQGLSAAETAAHIHGYAPLGMTAPPVFTLPLGTPKLGFWTYPAIDQNNIFDGLTYANIHSGTFTGGEIRGQIRQGDSIPPTRVHDWTLYNH